MDDQIQAPDPPLCQVCRGITAEALVSEEGYKHVQTREDLKLAGCALCWLLRQSLLSGPMGGVGYYRTNRKGRDGLRLKLVIPPGHLTVAFRDEDDELEAKVRDIMVYTQIGKTPESLSVLLVKLNERTLEVDADSIWQHERRSGEAPWYP
jgi:hypothetical protein